MEPIQDDIELLREAVATGGFDYAVRGVYQEALDRLVAERDRLREELYRLREVEAQLRGDG
jgi:hypothetical protein